MSKPYHILYYSIYAEKVNKKSPKHKALSLPRCGIWVNSVKFKGVLLDYITYICRCQYPSSSDALISNALQSNSSVEIFGEVLLFS